MSRIVVVTGSASGIGAAAAAGFAAAGDTVIATVRNPGSADELRALVGDAANVSIEGLDVTDRAAAEATIDGVITRYGRIDVLVNNAGVGSKGTLEELAVEDFEASMAVNFYGVLYTTKRAFPHMRRAGSGRIIAVTSLGGVLGQPFNDAYCAAKFAVEGLYESLRPVAAGCGVHVTIFEPGPVATAFSAKSRAAALPSTDVDEPIRTFHQRYDDMMAGGRPGQSSADCAAEILAVANDPAPKLRYQSSKFTSKLAGLKLADLDGERVLGLTSNWIADPAG
ncbi:MAG: SDR family NAD(P)-dependent oxidoreductase [Acidimicrobiia bacterium]